MTNTPKMVSLTDAQAALTKAVDDRGADYRYPDDEKMPNPGRLDGDGYDICRYVFANGTPGCIAGVALANVGVPVERLARFDLAIHSAEDVVNVLDIEGEFSFEPGVANLLLDAQSQQDSGMRWGEAASYAIDSIGIYN